MTTKVRRLELRRQTRGREDRVTLLIFQKPSHERILAVGRSLLRQTGQDRRRFRYSMVATSYPLLEDLPILEGVSRLAWKTLLSEFERSSLVYSLASRLRPGASMQRTGRATFDIQGRNTDDCWCDENTQFWSYLLQHLLDLEIIDVIDMG
ncbi:hypothetical protein CC86DRAFT_62088 [Ophiobolus disseminans]|uniref:Uncharacterized protein n=1 Tax=Ophiobolus disseminans TaxID=1469910 RepID=A0A6A6ZSY5_9PLEO|nr:hypothetical protein CC86DRAFT_62088 [Ophiobolus disseminans]